MKDMKRSLRRAHRDRMKGRAKTIIRNQGFSDWLKDRWEHVLGIRGDTFTVCSCHACGNPRKWFNETTMSEKRFSQKEDDDV